MEATDLHFLFCVTLPKFMVQLVLTYFLTHPLISFICCIVAADFIALVQSNAKMGPLQRTLLQSFACTNAILSIFWARARVAHVGVPSAQMAMT